MKKQQSLKFGLFLFVIGFVGILTLMFTEIPFNELPIPEEAIAKLDEIPAIALKLMMLINPTLMLIVATVLGTVFYKKVNLQVPIIESLFNGTRLDHPFKDLKYGAIGGVVAGLAMMLLMFLFKDYLPESYLSLGEKFKPHVLTRFLYGGITEEILMRFGLMTFIVWLVHKITNNLKPMVYWVGILLAAIIFGLGHFPILFMLVKEPTTILLVLILLANAIGGIVFGWLYWKKGLEMAFVAHIFAHITMLIIEQFIL